MRPLSDAQKKWLYDRVALGPGSRFARPAYDALIRALIWAHRQHDRLVARDEGDVSRVTALIKTFERPYAVKRLVHSLQRVYPTLRIVVVDDSRRPTLLEGVHHVHLPFDSGASAGRNRGLDEIITPYFLLLDDDFVSSSLQRISAWIEFLDRHPEVDILGGRCIDLPLHSRHPQERGPLFEGLPQPKIPLGTKIEHCEVVDKVQNFFVARTDAVRKVGWNEALKTSEHAEFFMRARGTLVTAFDPDMHILHVKYPFDVKYLVYRWRTPEQF